MALHPMLTFTVLQPPLSSHTSSKALNALTSPMGKPAQAKRIPSSDQLIPLESTLMHVQMYFLN